MNWHREDLAPLFPDQNPFSTWAVRPGAIRYRFVNGSSVEWLLKTLEAKAWWGEIVGPHGTGKSTLIHTLMPALEEMGRTIIRHTVKPGERQLPIVGTDVKRWGSQTQVIIEGFEHLGERNRTMLKKVCQGQGVGLLVSAHTPMGLPPLFQTEVTLNLAQTLVRDLIPEDCDFIAENDVAAAFAQHGQNLREALFDLYDLYEKRRPKDQRL